MFHHLNLIKLLNRIEVKTWTHCQNFILINTNRRASNSNQYREYYQKNSRMNELNSLFMTIISNGYAGTPKSLVISSNTQTYLFNIGENVQRAGLEASFKFNNIRNVFITRKSWDCFGGFVGSCLSLQESQKSLTVHGPFDIKDIMMKTFHLGNLAKINLIQHDYEANSTYKDHLTSVKAIKLELNSVKEEEEPVMKRQRILETKVYAYKITLNNPQPSIIVKKLAEFNVPNGPLCAALKRGESVVLPDGKVVHQNDVCDFSNCKDVKILVLDCPDESYFDFIENDAEINDETLGLIVHLGNSKILSNRRYQAWFESKLNVKQILLDEAKENVTSAKKIHHQKILNLINENIYPQFPKFKSNTETSECSYSKSSNNDIQYGLSNMKISFRPNINIVDSSWFKEPTIEDIRQGLLLDADDDFDDKLAKFKLEIQTLLDERQSISENIYPIVNFLGTGSSTPGKYRNTSGILVEINEKKSILLDCGEGTLSQMMNLFAEDGCKNKLLNIKAIFISHFHADHIQGLFSVIVQRKRVFDELNLKYENLFLCLPLNVVDYLKKYFEYFDENIFTYVDLIINASLHPSPRSSSQTNDERKIRSLIETLNLKNIYAIPVPHVHSSCALMFETNENNSFKCVFSGDCEPSDVLVQYGLNCDLLIHEATFDSTMKSDAKSKKHSTTIDAIKIGKKMNAKSTILWHFSQRYHKIPIMDEIINYNNVSISFDNMIVRRTDLTLLPSFNEIIKSLFKKEHDSLTQKLNLLK